MAADGLIVLGLDVNQTQAEIQAGLDSILNKTKTKEIILKTAIEKAETEKKIDSVVKSLNKKTVKMGVEVDARSVNNILAAQQKIASTQAKLNAQMKEYRDTASKISLTLNKDSWNPFSRAVKDGDFTKANEILKSTKKQIEAYNAAVQKMNSDTSVSGSVSSIVEQFSKLKDVSTETQKRVNLLKANLAQFENADSTQKKLSAYKRLQTIIESLSDELRILSSSEKSQSSDLSIKKKIDDARSSLKVFKTQYEGIGNSTAAQKVTAAITALDTALKGVDSSASGGALAKQWDKVSAAIDNAKRAVAEYNAASKSKKTTSGILDDIKNAETYVKKLNTTYASIGDSAGAEKLKKVISELQTALSGIDKTATGNKLSAQWDSVASKIADAKRAVAEYNAEQSAIGSLGERFDNITDKIQSALSNIGDSGLKGAGIDRLTDDLTKLQEKSKQVQKDLGDLDPNNAEDVKRLSIAIKKLETDFSKLKDNASSFKDPISAQQLATNIEKTKQKVAEYSETYSAIKSRPDLVKELNELQKRAKDLSTKTDLKKFNADFEQFNTKVKQAGLHTKSLGDRLKDAFKNFASFFSASRLIYEATNQIRQMIINVSDLDAAMINLKKVTDETDASYSSFLSRATSNAKELGTTVVDLVNATTNFSRLGFSLSEAEELGQLATIYANVGDLNSIDDATNSIISTMKGFGIESENASSILDKFNEVGNNFAISSGDIGEALQRSASSMAAANNTIDETIALITAANTVVQDATSVGTAFKTISMRIRGATTEMEQAGLDMEGMADSTATLRKEIMALSGVDIMIDDNTFKSTYRIIEELATKWGELTDIQQASITELIAGKRQGNIISTVMENFDIAQDALNSSLGSAGSAMREYNIYLDGIEAKTNQFKATFQELSVNLIDSEFVKGIIGSGTVAITILDTLIQKLGGIGNILLMISGLLIVKNSSFLVNMLGLLIKPVKNLVESFSAARSAGLSFGQVISNAFAQATAGATAFQSALGIVGIAITAISAVVAIAKAAYDTFHKSNEELIQDADNLKSAYNTASDEISSNLSTLRGLEKEYNKLSAGVDDYGNNVSLATDDYERYREIVSTILDISPELISGYDAEGNAIANKNGLLEKSIALMEKEQRIKIKDFVSNDSIITLLEGETARLEERLDDINIPDDLVYSGVKILDSGELKHNYINKIPEYIEQAIGVIYNYEGIENYIQKNAEAIKNNIGTILNNASKDFTDEYGNTWKALSESQVADLENYILSITGAVDTASSSMNEILQFIPQSVASYYDLGDAEKEFLTRYANSFSITADTTKSDILQIKNDIIDFTNFLSSNKDLSNTIDIGIALDIGKDVNGNSLTVSEYQKEVQNFLNEISSFDEETQIIIRTVFGIEKDSVELDGEVNKAIEHVKNLLQDQYEYVVDDMKTDEVLQIYYNISAKPNSLTPEGLQLELLKASASYDTLSESVNNIISNVRNAQKIIASQTTGQSISIADFNAQDMQDYRSALEYVNGTMQLNADKVREITEAKAEEQIAISETNKALAQSQYIENSRQIEKYRQKLENKSIEQNESEESIRNSIDALLKENSALIETCKQYDLLTASLKEAVGAYQHWLNAQSSSDYGDMADDAVSAIQNIRDTYDSESDIFGNFGSRKFDAAIEFIIPDSVNRDDLSAIESYMADFQSYLRFDDDRNVEGLNVDEFLKKSVEAGLMNYSEDNGWTIAGQTAMEDFAEGLGLSMGVVQAFFDELQLKGAEFDWSDETVKTFGDLAVEATEAAGALRNIESNKEYDIKIDISDLSTTEEQLSTLDDTINEMNAIKAKPKVDISEIEHANSVIRYCIAQKQLLEQPDVMRVDTSQVEGDLGDALLLLQQFQQAQNNLETLVAIGADTSEAEATVNSLAEKIQNQEVTYINCGLDIDTTSIDTIQQSISGLTAETIVTLGVDATAIDGYNPEAKTCSVIYDPDTDLLPKSFGPYEATVEYIADLTGLPTHLKTLIRNIKHAEIDDAELNGTAHVGGTAKARGDWGKARGGSTLVGELGREIVVDPHTGRWYTVGDNGAEFVNIPAGAIVFNHKQTESLLEHGYVSGRASALVSGTAMVTGGYRPYVPSTSSGNSSGTTTSNNNNNNSATLTVDAELDPTNLEKQLEDTLDELSEEIDEIIGNFEHKIFLLEKNGGSTEEIVAIYRKMQEAVHEQVDKYRALGLDENSDFIQDLGKQWWDYHDAIVETITSMYDGIISGHENQISLTENWLEQAIESANTSDISRYTGDIIEHYRDMQNTVHEQAEYYRSLGYAETSDEISQLSNLWWDYYDKIKTVSAEAWEQVVDNANDALDNIQGMYDGLKNAAQEYAEYGYITVDSLQDILSYGIEYLAFLQDENGQLVINEESIQKVIAARTQQMAIESALNYIQQLRTALTNNDTVALLNLTNATNIAAASTWDLVYAQLQLLGLSDEQYNNALQRINAMRSLTDMAVTSIGRIDTSAKEALEETSTALEDLLKYVEEMIKQEVENQISALEDQIDKYREIVDLQKESLDLEREKDKYTKDVTEKTKSIAELQARIAMLDLDDSREAQAEKRKLQEQLAEEQADLAETQADHAYEATSDMLDNMADAYEKEKQQEIEILEDSISSAEKIYQLAIDRINNHWDTLYDDLINWNYQYGNTVQSELISAWNAASGAVQQYGSYLNAVAATQAQIAAFDASSGFTTVGTTGDYDTSGGQTMSRIKEIVAQMKANSQAHHNASTEEKARLNQANLDLGKELQKLIGRTVVRGNDGVWYLDKVGGAQLYSTYPYSAYHTGGIVGDDATPKQDEMFALLKKREAVFTEPQQEVVYRVLKADETIAGKLGISGGLYHSMNSSGYAEMQSHNAVMRDMQQAQAASGGNHVSQSIGDVTVPVHVMVTEKLDKSDIRRLSKEISSVAAEGISEAFIKRGKGTLRDSLLKP